MEKIFPFCSSLNLSIFCKTFPPCVCGWWLGMSTSGRPTTTATYHDDYHHYYYYYYYYGHDYDYD